MDLYATLNVGFRETHRGKSPAVPPHSEKGLSSDFERFRQRRWRGRYFTLERTDLAIEHVGAKDTLLLLNALFSGRRYQITGH